MKTSSTALLATATMVAASTPAARAAAATTLHTSGESDTAKQTSNVAIATTSSGSERRHLSGKSGKSANALGLATPDDYKWFVGHYTVKDPYTLVALSNGESDISFSSTFEGGSLEVKNVLDDDDLPTLKFEAAVYFTWNLGGIQSIFREVYDGVASYNPNFTNQVTLYSDHLEFQKPDGSWALFPGSAASDVGHIKCSKLASVPSGRSIVCDGYNNDSFTANVPDVGEVPVHFENMASAVWTDVTDESS